MDSSSLKSIERETRRDAGGEDSIGAGSKTVVDLIVNENVDFVRIPPRAGTKFVEVVIRIEKLYRQMPSSLGTQENAVTVKFGVRREDENFSRGVTQAIEGKTTRGVKRLPFTISLGRPCDVGMILWVHFGSPPQSDNHVAEIFLESYTLITGDEKHEQSC